MGIPEVQLTIQTTTSSTRLTCTFRRPKKFEKFRFVELFRYFAHFRRPCFPQQQEPTTCQGFPDPFPAVEVEGIPYFYGNYFELLLPHRQPATMRQGDGRYERDLLPFPSMFITTKKER